jgi:hypothetical protein
MPVILAIQEAEIRRIEVRSQYRQIVWVCKSSISKIKPSQKKGWQNGSNLRVPA